MITAKHLEPIIAELLNGEKPRAFHAIGSKFWWYIPKPGHYAFAVLSPEPIINIELVEGFPLLKEMLDLYENGGRPDMVEFKPTGTVKDGKYTELSNGEGLSLWVQKAYFQLFAKCRFFQISDKPKSSIYCADPKTFLLEGIVLPYHKN